MPAPHSSHTPHGTSSALRTHLLSRWPLHGSDELAEQLLDAWSSQRRGYHDLLHLQEVLDRIDQLCPGHVSSPLAVVLAAWFHDAVYDDQPDPEGRSADWAREALTDLLSPTEVDEVVRLVLLTREHSTTADDAHGIALCDADLAILAAPPGRYSDYVAGVRQEYAAVPDALFRAGRAAVLRSFLERDHVFVSPAARSAWEADARRNARAELTELEAREASDDADPRPGVG